MAELKLKMLIMHQVTFLISTMSPGCTFQLRLCFSHLLNSCQNNAPRIFDTSCITNFDEIWRHV